MADVDVTTKLCCRCLHWKAQDMFYKNKRSKSGYCTACKACMDFARALWLGANPEKQKDVAARCYQKHKERRSEEIKAWGKKNRGRKNETKKAWRENNRAKDTAYTLKWQAENPDKVAALCAARKAHVKRATPSWANKFFIAEAYHLAKLREKVCGGEWQVDHIIPLRGKNVCGLHVEFNLQVIPGKMNRQKYNLHA